MAFYKERMKEVRRWRGLTQVQLAARIGCCKQAVQQWESGVTEPREHHLLALSQALECAIDYISDLKNPFSDMPDAKDILPQKIKTKLIYPIIIDIVEFTPPKEITTSQNHLFLMIDISKHPSATVAGIFIETENETIPLKFSPEEIKKIEWEENRLYIHFGEKIPTYTRGWIYLQEFKTI